MSDSDIPNVNQWSLQSLLQIFNFFSVRGSFPMIIEGFFYGKRLKARMHVEQE